MSNLFNIIGERGESAIRAALISPIDVSTFKGYPRFPFRSQFLGEKAETFDFIVYLLDGDQRSTGAYFFLQVKATEVASGKASCSAPFPAEDVRRAILFKAPSYVAAADFSRAAAEIYIRGLSHDRKRGISSIKRSSNFELDAVKVAVYDEVSKFHAKNSRKFVSKVG